MGLAGIVSTDTLKYAVCSSERHLKVLQINISRTKELALSSIHKSEREQEREREIS